MPAVFYFIDVEKVFDQVEWPFLKKMQFGPQFCSWIELIYSTQITAILLDGCNSPKIQLGKGFRQGCPLFPLFLNIVIEVMAIAVTNQTMIKGISVAGTEHKLSLYTYDIILFLWDPQNSLTALQYLLKAYGQYQFIK